MLSTFRPLYLTTPSQQQTAIGTGMTASTSRLMDTTGWVVTLHPT